MSGRTLLLASGFAIAAACVGFFILLAFYSAPTPAIVAVGASLASVSVGLAEILRVRQ